MRVAVIALYPMVRKGIITIISKEEDIQFVGEASSFQEGLELLEDVKPDIAIVDANMGDKSGLELILLHRSKETATKFILIGYYENERFIEESIRMGVEGYVLREVQPIEILYSLRQVYGGKRYFDSDIIGFINNINRTQEDSLLTPREKEVLTILSKGLTNKEIAKALFITEHTVKKHVSQILSKLELQDRTQAAIYANNKILTNEFKLHNKSS